MKYAQRRLLARTLCRKTFASEVGIMTQCSEKTHSGSTCVPVHEDVKEESNGRSRSGVSNIYREISRKQYIASFGNIASKQYSENIVIF